MSRYQLKFTKGAICINFIYSMWNTLPKSRFISLAMYLVDGWWHYNSCTVLEHEKVDSLKFKLWRVARQSGQHNWFYPPPISDGIKPMQFNAALKHQRNLINNTSNWGLEEDPMKDTNLLSWICIVKVKRCLCSKFELCIWLIKKLNMK